MQNASQPGSATGVSSLIQTQQPGDKKNIWLIENSHFTMTTMFFSLNHRAIKDGKKGCADVSLECTILRRLLNWTKSL